MSINGALALTEVRARAAAALAPATPADPPVHVDYPDAVQPPCLVVTWDDPWLAPETLGLYRAQLSVLCVAGRVEAGPGVTVLEELAAYTAARMASDGYPWGLPAAQAPRELVIAKVNYLGARVNYGVRVSLE